MIGHQDKSLATDALSPDGFRLLGNIPASQAWEQRAKGEQPMSDQEYDAAMHRILTMHAEERARGVFRLPGKDSEALYALLQQERDKGFWLELTVEEAEAQLGGFAAWLFFGIQEATKTRGCLSPEEANGPHMVFLPNHIYMCGLDGYVTLCQAFAEGLRKTRRNPVLRGWAEDYENGFRQFDLASPDRRLLCAAARAPDGTVKVFLPRKLLFGPRGAPHVFCRVSDLASSVAAVLLLIPNVPHVDDMVGVEEEDGVDSARSAFVAFHQALNLKLKTEKARPPRTSQGGASELIALGGLVRFNTTLAERVQGVVCTLDLPFQKAQKYASQISGVINSGTITPALAGKLVGQWDHASAVALGRSGRAFTWPLREFQNATAHGRKVPAWATVRAALFGFLLFLTAARPIKVHASGTLARSSALVFVDAALEGEGCRLAGLAWGPGWCVWFSLLVLPGQTRLIPWRNGHIINEAEALSAVVFLESLSSRLSALDVFLFIDSSAAEGVLLKAYSKSPELTVIAGLFWRAVRKAAAAAWVGRVPSRLNVADGPTRGDHSVVDMLQAERITAQLPDESLWSFVLDYLQRPCNDSCTDANPDVQPLTRQMKRRRAHQGQA
jgi:hypothetical protein